MKTPLLTALAFIALLMIAPVDHQPTLDPKIDHYLRTIGFEGSALVAESGRLRHHQGYGYAVKEWQQHNGPETRFRVASLSKTLTAALVMILVQDDKIDLDATLHVYLPEYPAAYADQVTVGQLLTHRSGIARLFTIPGWTTGLAQKTLSKQAFLSLIAAMPLAHAPGSRRHYSSANYYILGSLLEAVTGQHFGDILKEKITGPLGMQKTDIFRPGELIPKLAAGYKPVGGDYSFCPPVSGKYCLGKRLNLGLFRASGSLHSTAGDMLKWDQALYGDALLSPESKAFLFDPATKAAWESVDIILSDVATRVQIAHGALEGYAALLVRMPDKRRTIILLNNTAMPYHVLADTALGIATAMP